VAPALRFETHNHRKDPCTFFIFQKRYVTGSGLADAAATDADEEEGELTTRLEQYLQELHLRSQDGTFGLETMHTSKINVALVYMMEQVLWFSANETTTVKELTDAWDNQLNAFLCSGKEKGSWREMLQSNMAMGRELMYKVEEAFDGGRVCSYAYGEFVWLAECLCTGFSICSLRHHQLNEHTKLRVVAACYMFGTMVLDLIDAGIFEAAEMINLYEVSFWVVMPRAIWGFADGKDGKVMREQIGQLHEQFWAIIRTALNRYTMHGGGRQRPLGATTSTAGTATGGDANNGKHWDTDTQLFTAFARWDGRTLFNLEVGSYRYPARSGVGPSAAGATA
jgi:hypothetical protein